MDKKSGQQLNRKRLFSKMNTNHIDVNLTQKRHKAEEMKQTEQYTKHSSQNQLEALLKLDFKHFETPTQFSVWFLDIAENLMNDQILVVNSVFKFRITEVEVFFNSKAHPDTYTICNEEKSVPGQWFIHNMMPQFNDENQNRLELAFGRPNDEAWGSFIIKAISSLDELDPQFINGTANVANKIIACTCEQDHHELKYFEKLPKFSRGAFDELSVIYLAQKQNVIQNLVHVYPPSKIWKSPRIGLSLKKFDKFKVNFWLADYRFGIVPAFCSTKKSYFILGMLKEGLSNQQIKELLPVGKKYLEELTLNFELGLKEKTKQIIDYKNCSEDLDAMLFAFVYGLNSRSVQPILNKEGQIDAGLFNK